jgi:DNA invertase Pin-like site-specific DNA recombinase
VTQPKRERAALYVRVSREDGEQSQSIGNQRELLISFAEQMGFLTAGVYADDGYSGTNFDRPAFRNLLRDIESGKIDVVITKDLSRLGRDYIGTGEFLERYFPSRRVRYIAVNDRIDSGSGIDKMAPFLYVFNDFYPRDISDKVRAVLNFKKISGDFIGSFAPFGYKKDPGNKARLVIDDSSAWIVRELFDVFLATVSIAQVIRHMSLLAVPPPSVFSGRNKAEDKKSMRWNASTVRRILTNPTYAGHLTQNRSRKLGVKIDRQVTVPREQWITVSNTHAPIVSQDIFDRANELLKTKQVKTSKKSEGHLLSGLVFCADCGSSMTFQKDGGNRRYIVCRGSRGFDDRKSCTSHCVREDRVEQGVIETLRKLCTDLAAEQELDAFLQKNPERTRPKSETLPALEQKLKKNSAIRYQLYSDRINGTISDADYLAFQKLAEEECAMLSSGIERLKAEPRFAEDEIDRKRELQDILCMQAPDRSALLWLIEKILIHADKRIEIRFRFRNPSDHSAAGPIILL